MAQWQGIGLLKPRTRVRLNRNGSSFLMGAKNENGRVPRLWRTLTIPGGQNQPEAIYYGAPRSPGVDSTRTKHII